jgi:hypothetical protein
MDTETKYLVLKKIVDEHQMGRVDSVKIDAVTAGMLLGICDALSPAAREKFLKLPVAHMVDLGWRLYR